MAKPQSRVQNALDEGRILVLGIQIVIGFEFRSFLEPGFAEQPPWARVAALSALCAMLLAFALVVLPSAFHRLAERGEDSARLERVASGAIGAALLPFAVGLGLEVGLAARRVEGLAAPTGLALGGAAAAVAVAWWYVLPAAARRPYPSEDAVSKTPLDEKIRHVLTEARMVLPGAQALLGFQLAVTLVPRFRELPRPAQLIHLADILLTALAVVLLVAPAAHHRLAERGEETEAFHRLASRLVLAAMAPLALAMSGELALVGHVVMGRPRRAAALGLGVLALFVGAWFVAPLLARARRRRQEPVTPP